MKWTFYEARVNGRVVEQTDSEKRKEELLDILPKVYPGRKIEIVQRKRVEVKVKYEAIFTYEVDDDYDVETEVRLDLQDIGTGGGNLTLISSEDLEVEEIA